MSHQEAQNTQIKKLEGAFLFVLCFFVATFRGLSQTNEYLILSAHSFQEVSTKNG